MNFDLMAEILTKKNDPKFTSNFIRNLYPDEAEILVHKLSNTEFLERINSEIKNSICELETIALLRSKYGGSRPESLLEADKHLNIDKYCSQLESKADQLICVISRRIKEIEDKNKVGV